VTAVAWSLIGLTWVENSATLEGLTEFVGDGISERLLEGILTRIDARRGT
jgi:hypothetical protein